MTYCLFFIFVYRILIFVKDCAAKTRFIPTTFYLYSCLLNKQKGKICIQKKL